MSTPVVFISAATIDLSTWRAHLHTAFSRAGFRVRTQDESLSSATGNVKRLLIDTIAESDCVIHLAGLGYGSHAQSPFPEAPEFQCSWTQFEYYQAHAMGKKVIAFACAPSLSADGFVEKGDPSERAHKAQLQLRHRERIVSGQFEGTPLVGKVERTSNENIPSVQSLLEAVASAVGTLHTIDQESRKQLTTELASISHSLSSVDDKSANILRYVRWIAALLVAGFIAKLAWETQETAQTIDKLSATSRQINSTAQTTQATVKSARDDLLDRLGESQHLTSGMVAEKVYGDVAASTGIAVGVLRQLTLQADSRGGLIAYSRFLAAEGRVLEGRALLQLVAETEMLKPKADFAIIANALFSAGKAALESDHIADAQFFCARAIDAASSIPDAEIAKSIRREYADHFLETSFRVVCESPGSDGKGDSIFLEQCEDIIELCDAHSVVKARAQLLQANTIRFLNEHGGVVRAEQLAKTVLNEFNDTPHLRDLADNILVAIQCSERLNKGKLNLAECVTMLKQFDEIADRSDVSESEAARACLFHCANAIAMGDQLDEEQAVELLTGILSRVSTRLSSIHDPRAQWLVSRAKLRVAEIKLNLASRERLKELESKFAREFESTMESLQGSDSNPSTYITGGSKSTFVMAPAAIRDYDLLRKEIDRRHRPGSWAIAQRNFASSCELLFSDEVEKRRPPREVGGIFRARPSRRLDSFDPTEDPEIRARNGAIGRLEDRELPELLPGIVAAVEACDGAMQIWTMSENPGMHRQVRLERAILQQLQADVSPANDALVIYEQVVSTLRAIQRECLEENDEDMAQDAGLRAYSAELTRNSLHDEILRSRGRKTRLDLEMEREVDRLMEGLQRK